MSKYLYLLIVAILMIALVVVYYFNIISSLGMFILVLALFLFQVFLYYRIK